MSNQRQELTIEQEQARIDGMFAGVAQVDAWMIQAVRVAQAALDARKEA